MPRRGGFLEDQCLLLGVYRFGAGSWFGGACSIERRIGLPLSKHRSLPITLRRRTECTDEQLNLPQMLSQRNNKVINQTQRHISNQKHDRNELDAYTAGTEILCSKLSSTNKQTRQGDLYLLNALTVVDRIISKAWSNASRFRSLGSISLRSKNYLFS